MDTQKLRVRLRKLDETVFDDFGRAITAFIAKHEAEAQESSQ